MSFPHHDEPHYVYRCYDAQDRLLYVGCTYNPPKRMRQHSRQAKWFGDMARIRFTVFPTRSYGLERERQAIIAERPLHNVKFVYEVPNPDAAAAWRVRQAAFDRDGLTARERKEASLRRIRAERQASA